MNECCETYWQNHGAKKYTLEIGSWYFKRNYVETKSFLKILYSGNMTFFPVSTFLLSGKTFILLKLPPKSFKPKRL